MLPVGGGTKGIAGGELDLVVVHDAGLAVALAEDFAIGISHFEFETSLSGEHSMGRSARYRAKRSGYRRNRQTYSGNDLIFSQGRKGFLGVRHSFDA